MNNITRREFLKISLLALGALAAAPRPNLPLPDGEPAPVGTARVTVAEIPLYVNPNPASRRLGKLRRDQIIDLWEVVRSKNGPSRNPVWYRIQDGWVHSAHLQRVDHQHLNPLVVQPEGSRAVGEITVAYTQSLRPDRQGGWHPCYRLYYQSTHWVTGVRQGPDGSDWYDLRDERLQVVYCVPAAHVRLLKESDYAPLSPDLPLSAKRIEVSISDQVLRAYEYDQLVREFKVSSGLPQYGDPINDIPTETPTGTFHVSVKWPARHMGNGYLTDDLEAYELPGVPWNMFFHESGYALHGAYWHDNFGIRMSHGCVNIPPAESLWLFRWTDPVYTPGKYYTQGKGTVVNIT